MKKSSKIGSGLPFLIATIFLLEIMEVGTGHMRYRTELYRIRVKKHTTANRYIFDTSTHGKLVPWIDRFY